MIDRQVSSISLVDITISKIRVGVVLASALYFVCLYYIYVFELRRWDYLGFPLGDYSVPALLYCFVLAMIPAMMFPLFLRRLSVFVVWFVYFFIFVPALLYPVLQAYRDDTLLLSTALFLGMLLLFICSGASSGHLDIRVSRRWFLRLFMLAYIALVLYVFYVFRDSLSLADITDVYGQRAQADIAADGTYVGYATGVLSGAFNPFLIGVGLVHRRHRLLVLGVGGQIFIYATFALKSVLLSIGVIPLMYFLVFRGERPRALNVALFCLAMMAGPVLLGLFYSADDSVLYENFMALVYMRIVGMVGALTGVYYDFFAQSAVTLYSHINVLGRLFGYPYSMQIGQVIGEFMGLDMNANANFFATDGLAAAGLLGVVFIGAVVGICLRFFDMVVPARNVRLMCVVAVPSLVNLANSSWFTTLLTGGFLILVLCVALWNSEASTVHPSTTGAN
ncbi:hypothetical protein [Herbaspirillum sp. VT-16-41]|uniref:hypothetical protein n=1 Tax=Herbaspirillum sp. VT-16-41 TaxID=1953765 RepID=UPI000981E3D2|nr:hypothetical protein [Herbaspirillum sp. VT-16-41]ONN67092.1 hypothetical protein BTM36_07010 [Herbaspirillum sp. VT-16-41]